MKDLIKGKYLVWSIEHDSWWASEHCGYTHRICNAGIYTKKEAKDIVKGANQHGGFCECMIPIEMTSIAESIVVDEKAIEECLMKQGIIAKTPKELAKAIFEWDILKVVE